MESFWPASLTDKAAAVWRSVAPFATESQTASASPTSRWRPVQPLDENISSALMRLCSTIGGASVRWSPVGILLESHVGGKKSSAVLVYCTGEQNQHDVAGTEVVSVAEVLLKSGISVLHYSSNESTETAARFSNMRRVVDRLRSSEGGGFQSVALWGRGRAADAALRTAAADPSIAAFICDSADVGVQQWPAWMQTSMQELAQRLPSVTCAPAARSNLTIRDIAEAPLLQVASKCFVPALFMHSSADKALSPAPVHMLHRAYAGEKQLLLIDGSESLRPQPVIARAALLLIRAFRQPVVEDDGRTVPDSAVVDRLVRMSACVKSLKPMPLVAHASGEEVRRLLGSTSTDERCKGLLLTSLLACPALRLSSFSRIPAKKKSGRERGVDHGSVDLSVSGTAMLPSDSCEIMLAWALVPKNDDNLPHSYGGDVYFFLLSRGMASLTVVRVAPCTPSETTDGNQTLTLADVQERPHVQSDQLTCLGISTEVETLALQEMRQLWGSSRTQIELTVARSNDIHLQLGGATLFKSTSCRPGKPSSRSCMDVSVWGALSRSEAQQTNDSCSIAAARKPQVLFSRVFGRDARSESRKRESKLDFTNLGAQPNVMRPSFGQPCPQPLPHFGLRATPENFRLDDQDALSPDCNHGDLSDRSLLTPERSTLLTHSSVAAGGDGTLSFALSDSDDEGANQLDFAAGANKEMQSSQSSASSDQAFGGSTTVSGNREADAGTTASLSPSSSEVASPSESQDEDVMRQQDRDGSAAAVGDFDAPHASTFPLDRFVPAIGCSPCHTWAQPLPMLF